MRILKLLLVSLFFTSSAFAGPVNPPSLQEVVDVDNNTTTGINVAEGEKISFGEPISIGYGAPYIYSPSDGILEIYGDTGINLMIDVVSPAMSISRTSITMELPLVSFDGDAEFLDGEEIRLGTDDDLTLKHDGTNAILDINTGNLLPAAAGEGTFGSGTVPFAKFNSSTGYRMTTNGGCAARINNESYFACIDSGTTNGIFFTNVAPKGIELHIGGVPIHKWYMGATTSEGVYQQLVRTADPSGTGMPCLGCTYVHDNGAGIYRLKVYDGSAWVQPGNTCPVNFTKYSLGCIKTDEEGSGTWDVAREDCYDTYGGRLPTPFELQAAANNLALTNETDDEEWTDSMVFAAAVVVCGYQKLNAGTADESADFAAEACGTTEAYRCFVPFVGGI